MKLWMFGENVKRDSPFLELRGGTFSAKEGKEVKICAL
jgi:hypothetical protein